MFSISIDNYLQTNGTNSIVPYSNNNNNNNNLITTLGTIPNEKVFRAIRQGELVILKMAAKNALTSNNYNNNTNTDTRDINSLRTQYALFR